MLNRTTGGLASFPHIIDDIISINEGYYNDEGNDANGAGFNTAYYYYFYDWKINNDWEIGGITCESNVTSVLVSVSCTDLDNDQICDGDDECVGEYDECGM